MKRLWRVTSLLLICLVALTACASPLSIASAPSADKGTATPTLTEQQQAIEAAPTDRVTLASGRYQLLMFYSPL